MRGLPKSPGVKVRNTAWDVARLRAAANRHATCPGHLGADRTRSESRVSAASGRPDAHLTRARPSAHDLRTSRLDGSRQGFSKSRDELLALA